MIITKKKLTIQEQIDALGEHKLNEIKKKFTFGGITPYDYQCVMYDEIGSRIARYRHPFYVKASVSAGKTIGFAMIASRCKEMGLSMMILARQAEIVSQDSEEITNFGVPNSVYCAGLNTKSAYFPVVVGSEGTVANGLFKALGDFAPMVVGIDECHQVDWEDIVEAQDRDESYELMTRPKNEAFMINGEKVEKGIKEVDERMNTVVWGAGRTQYTIIIMELMRRCRRVHGKELRIFGMTGSPYRENELICVENLNEPGFWREQVTDIDTNYLIGFGSVVPTYFGETSGLEYDLAEFSPTSEEGIKDYDKKTLKKMEDKIHKSQSLTQQIMRQVVELTKNRNSVLVTCAGQKHCQEAADALPEGITYEIITEKTIAKERERILDRVRRGEVKFTFQVQALTTGVNVPNWDTSVILRKIGSLTLLIQLLGRGMRLLKQWQIDQGMTKSDHLVLDYAGTLDELGQLYFDPILERAQYQRKGNGKSKPQACPKCNGINSQYAHRCIHGCGHWFKSQTCEDQKDKRTGEIVIKGCGDINSVNAKTCSGCGCSLTDPNEKLSGTAYKLNDWCDVLDFKVELTKNRAGIIYSYWLRDCLGVEFKARELFFPESDNKICKTLWKTKGVMPHVDNKDEQRRLSLTRSAVTILSSSNLIKAPLKVTHRKNGKGDDIIARKDFTGES